MNPKKYQQIVQELCERIHEEHELVVSLKYEDKKFREIVVTSESTTLWTISVRLVIAIATKYNVLSYITVRDSKPAFIIH